MIVPLQIIALHTKSLFVDSICSSFPLKVWQWSNGMQGVGGSKGVDISNLIFGFVHYTTLPFFSFFQSRRPDPSGAVKGIKKVVTS